METKQFEMMSIELTSFEFHSSLLANLLSTLILRQPWSSWSRMCNVDTLASVLDLV